jgi:hypothetical protein
MAKLTDPEIIKCEKIHSVSLNETLRKMNQCWHRMNGETATLLDTRMSCADWEPYESDKDKIKRLEKEIADLKAVNYSKNELDLLERELATLREVLTNWRNINGAYEFTCFLVEWINEVKAAIEQAPKQD